MGSWCWFFKPQLSCEKMQTQKSGRLTGVIQVPIFGGIKQYKFMVMTLAGFFCLYMHELTTIRITKRIITCGDSHHFSGRITIAWPTLLASEMNSCPRWRGFWILTHNGNTVCLKHEISREFPAPKFDIEQPNVEMFVRRCFLLLN